MRDRHRRIAVCLFLAVTTLAVFWPVRNHEFVNYDDDLYVTQNRRVQSGLTLESMVWAFTTTDTRNWHPLTWLSHMLDCEIYGLNAGGHHVTSVLLHLANSLLLFLVFHRMTGALWRSAFLSALFALHPIHVESVAWVAERKDVLSTLFWILTLGAYVRYVERPGPMRYLLVPLAFALGLMAKPMLVTLPFVLLLMDYWPLGRLRNEPSRGGGGTSKGHQASARGGYRVRIFLLIWEKAPLFALAAVSAAVTLFAQKSGGAMLWVVPLKMRVANALVSYVSYMGKMMWPDGLAVLYPHPGMVPMGQAVGAALLLALISLFTLSVARRYPYLAVGWLWYLGTLVPVVGLAQVGVQSMADRYTYVPLIGIFVIVCWAMADLATKWHRARTVLAVLAGVVVLSLMARTWFQVRYWQSNITLFEHAVQVTKNNYIAHNNLGNALVGKGELEAAIEHYSKALRLSPRYGKARNNLGLAMLRQGRVKEAIAAFTQALQTEPSYGEARDNLRNALQLIGKPDDEAEAHNVAAITLAADGKLDEAMTHLSEALRLRPDFAEAHYNMGSALATQGRLEEAVVHFSKALEIKPGYAEAHNNLGIALARQGKLDEAIDRFSEALRLKPNYAEAHRNLRQVLRLAGKSGMVSGPSVGQ